MSVAPVALSVVATALSGLAAFVCSHDTHSRYAAGLTAGAPNYASVDRRLHAFGHTWGPICIAAAAVAALIVLTVAGTVRRSAPWSWALAGVAIAGAVVLAAFIGVQHYHLSITDPL